MQICNLILWWLWTLLDINWIALIFSTDCELHWKKIPTEMGNFPRKSFDLRSESEKGKETHSNNPWDWSYTVVTFSAGAVSNHISKLCLVEDLLSLILSPIVTHHRHFHVCIWYSCLCSCICVFIFVCSSVHCTSTMLRTCWGGWFDFIFHLYTS